MGRRVGQRPLVVLAVDLNQGGGQRAQRLGAHALVIDVSARAAVGELNPSAGLPFIADLDVLTFEEGVRGVSSSGRSKIAVT